MDWSVLWSAASAISGIGVLVVTGIYAWLTHRLAKAAESQIWEASRARMIASVRTNQGGQLFLLDFVNVGQSPARSLRVTIDRPVHQQLGNNKPVTDAPFFVEGVRSFAPHHSVKFALGVSFRWLDDKTDRKLHPVTFDVTLEYTSAERQIKEVFPIDMENQYSLSMLDKDYLEEFARHFPEKFERSMRDLKRALVDVSEPSPKLKRNVSWPEWFSDHVWRKNQWK